MILGLCRVCVCYAIECTLLTGNQHENETECCFCKAAKKLLYFQWKGEEEKRRSRKPKATKKNVAELLNNHNTNNGIWMVWQ